MPTAITDGEMMLQISGACNRELNIAIIGAELPCGNGVLYLRAKRIVTLRNRNIAGHSRMRDVYQRQIAR